MAVVLVPPSTQQNKQGADLVRVGLGEPVAGVEVGEVVQTKVGEVVVFQVAVAVSVEGGDLQGQAGWVSNMQHMPRVPPCPC